MRDRKVLLQMIVPVVAGVALGFVIGNGVGKSSREVLLAPPSVADGATPLAALPVPAESEAPVVAVRGDSGLLDEARRLAAAEPQASGGLSTSQMLDRDHRADTYRRLLRSIVNKQFRDPEELVLNEILNPERRTLTPDEFAELTRIVDDHRGALLEAWVVRNELHDDILEAKLLANDVKTADGPSEPLPAPTGAVLSMGVLHRDGKSMSYEIRREDYPEFDATYDIEFAIKQELEYEVKEFFAKLPAR